MCAAITTTALGLGMAGYQAIDGANRAKKAERALNNYERQELDNAFKEISISTMGSDLLREENARTSAGLIDAARQGGSRSIIGSVPKVIAATNQINQEAAKMIDSQFSNREYAIAGDNARIEGVTENRDQANINALGSQVAAGRQDMWSGIMGAASSAAYGARNLTSGAPQPRAAVESANALSPSGIQPSSTYAPSAEIPFSNTPYSLPRASTNELFGDSYMYDDMINKYPRM